MRKNWRKFMELTDDDDGLEWLLKELREIAIKEMVQA
jgi:hypothetical protein